MEVSALPLPLSCTAEIKKLSGFPLRDLQDMPAPRAFVQVGIIVEFSKYFGELLFNVGEFEILIVEFVAAIIAIPLKAISILGFSAFFYHKPDSSCGALGRMRDFGIE